MHHRDTQAWEQRSCRPRNKDGAGRTSVTAKCALSALCSLALTYMSTGTSTHIHVSPWSFEFDWWVNQSSQKPNLSL